MAAAADSVVGQLVQGFSFAGSLFSSGLLLLVFEKSLVRGGTENYADRRESPLNLVD